MLLYDQVDINSSWRKRHMKQQLIDNKLLEIAEQKQKLRSQLKLKRAQLSKEEIAHKSQIIGEKLLTLPALQEAEVVMCYVSKDSEVATHRLIKKLLEMDKTVVVPYIVKKGVMKPAIIKDFSQLVQADFKTLQPKEANFFEGKIDVNLVPALAVSKTGDRLGWGAGFYDRFIKDYQPKLNLALVFDCQLVEEVPTTELDQKIDGVVTESEFLVK